MTKDVMPKDTVSSIMTREVLTVDSSETIRTALKRMVKEDVGSLIVTESGKAVGIITERDVTRVAASSSDPSFFESKVGYLMKSSLLAVGPETSIWDALKIMLNKGIRRLPVMRNDQLLGIITERDIVVRVLKVAYEPDIPENLRKLIEKLEKGEKL